VTVNDVDPNNGVPLRTGADVGGGIPSIAADPRSGKLYLVFEDSRFGVTHNDVAMSTSSNEGKTWTPVVKVNQTPKPVLAFTPAVNVLPDGTSASPTTTSATTPAPRAAFSPTTS
jgi:hypothetical protein